MRRPIIALAALLLTYPAFGQSTVLQGGAWSAGRAPMYASGGSGGNPIVIDSGSAGGGGTGVGLSELLLAARGTGTPPYAGQGNGPLGTNVCDYDGPITASAGYHYLCFSANADGGGLVNYGYGGTASALPFSFVINGVKTTFPSTPSGVIPTITVPLVNTQPICADGTSGNLNGCTGTQYALSYWSTTSVQSSAAVGATGQLLTGNTGAAPSWITAGTDGQVLLGQTSASPAFKTLSGDVTSVSAAGALTLGKVNGVSFPSSGTSGGIPYYSSSSSVASSAALTANQLVIGGGAGVAPAALGSLGTTTTVLHGNISGAPSFGAVSLTADITGTLAVGNGGTGQTTFTANLPLIGNGTSGIAQGSLSGTTTVFATKSGSWVAGDCLVADASSNVIDAGPCPGSGTVNVGATNQLAYYPGNSALVQGLPTANSGVLVTSAGGAPSISTTLPSGLTIPSATLSGTITTGITGSTQCIQANSSGVLSGISAKCVGGPSSSTSGNISTFNNSSGSLLADSGIYLKGDSTGGNISLTFSNAINLTGANESSAFGYGALSSVATPSNLNAVTALGSLAGRTLTSGAYTTLVGTAAGNKLTNPSDTVVVGAHGGVLADGSNLTVIGGEALSSSSSLGGVTQTGFQHIVAIGSQSAANMSTGASYGTYVGSQSGINVTTSQYDAGLGFTVLANSSGGSNAAVGAFALNHTTGNSVGIGYFACQQNTGSGNVCIGYQAGTNAAFNSVSNKLIVDYAGSATPLIVGDFNTKALQFNGNITVGTAALTTAAGEIGISKITASGSAPGAGGGKIALVCGTNTGTAKLIAYAGTSSTPTTILDNIGSGVSGC